MAEHYSYIVKVHLYKIVIAVLTVAVIALFIYYRVVHDTKVEAIIASLATGLFIALLLYLLAWNEHKEIELIKELGIVRILPHRDDMAHYRKLIVGAKKQIDVLGTTVHRLLEDFAHIERADRRELIDALHRN